MKELYQNCLEEVFTNQNLKILWENRQSKDDIIPLETDLPIRFKLNEKGTRNIELMLESPFGFYYKTIALVENENILFPRAFDINGQVNLGGFRKYGVKSEINVMIGAFSIDSLSLAMKKQDIDSYKTNDADFELVKATDGSMQTFVKKEETSFFSMAIGSDFYNSELDDNPISSFQFKNGGIQISPTNYTHTWMERLKTQRLLEVFTIENM